MRLFALTLMVAQLLLCQRVVAQELDLSLQLDGQQWQVELQPYTALSPDFQLKNEVAGLNVPAKPSWQSYRALVPELPSAQVAAVAVNEQLLGVLSHNDQLWQFSTTLAAVQAGEPVVLPVHDAIHFNSEQDCCLEQQSGEQYRAPLRNHLQPPAKLYIPHPQTGFHTYQQQIAAYLPSSVIAQDAGGDVDLALAKLALQINRLDLYLGRYALQRQQLSRVLIADEPGSSTGSTTSPIADGDWLDNHASQLQQHGRKGAPLLIASLSSDFAFNTVLLPNGASAVHMLRAPDGLQSGSLKVLNRYRPGEPMPSRDIRALLGRGERYLERAPASEWPVAPVAQDDYLLVRKQARATLEPLENDFDANGSEVMLKDVDASSLAGGKIRWRAELNQLEYQPAAGFSGYDRFSYRIVDSNGLSSEAQVNVVVLPQDLRTDNANYQQALDPLDGSFSLSLWFEAPKTDEYTQLLAKSAAPDLEGWSLSLSQGQLQIQLNYQDWDRLATDWRQPRSKLVQSLGEPLLDGWHHLVVIVDREQGVLRGYLDQQPFEHQAELPRDGGVIFSKSPLTPSADVEIRGLQLMHRVITGNEIAAEQLRKPKTYQ